MNNMKRLFLVFIFCPIMMLGAQTITLESCYEKAVEYSTISKQRELQDEITNSNTLALKTDYLPQAIINAQATYQSDVVTFPFSMPGVVVPILSKDQYRTSVDIQQLVYDGGYISEQKEIIKTINTIENSQLDISKSILKDKVSMVYLSVLLIDENMKITELLVSDLNSSIESLINKVENGVVSQSDLEKLLAERMRVEQSLIELSANRLSLIEMQSSLIGEQLSAKTEFVKPNIVVKEFSIESNRAEYRLFEAQRGNLTAQKSLINTINLPKLHVFASGGYGRPGFDMLSNDFEGFYIVGAKLSIPITKWSRTAHEKRVISKRKSLINQQHEEFSRKNRAEILNQLIEIDKYKQLIESDNAIIIKRKEIANAERSRLMEGVATSNDYIIELNAEKKAALAQKLHEIQLIQAIIVYKSLTGNN